VSSPGEEASGRSDGGLPEIVVAPARQDIRPGHDGDVIFEVRLMSDGRRGLPVFTSPKKLAAALGPAQPWVALPLRNVQAIMGGAGVERVVIDPAADPNAWRWQVSDLEDLGRRQ
jgi:SseB protein N-terminal domain